MDKRIQFWDTSVGDRVVERGSDEKGNVVDLNEETYEVQVRWDQGGSTFWHLATDLVAFKDWEYHPSEEELGTLDEGNWSERYGDC